MDAAAAQTEDLKAALGTGLLPIVQTILGVVTSQFLPMLQDFAKWISENESLIIPLATVLGILAAAVWVVNVAMYANPIGLVIAGIVLLIGIIVLLVTQWDSVVAFLLGAWQSFVDWGVQLFTGFAAWWSGIWEGIVGFFTGIWNSMVAFGVMLVMTFVQAITSILSTISGWWNGLWSGIASFFSGIWSGIVNFARTAIGNLVGFFTGLPGQIMGAISGAATWLVNVGRDIIAGLRRGISNAWDGLVSWFQGLFGNLIDIAKRILGIASPSKRFDVEVGYQLPAGAERGVKRGMPSLNKAIREMIEVPEPPAMSLDVARGASSSGRGRGLREGAATVVHLTQEILSPDPILGARQAAREVTRYLGV
jgi:phage-related protein